MKRLTLFIAAGLALVLAACQLPMGGGGSLRVILPGAASRAIADADIVRLQLTRGGAVVPLSGGDFIEKAMAGQTVAISGLTPGSGYAVLVSIGHRASSETFYRTDAFKKSDPFEISAGTDTAVTVTLADTRIAVLDSTSGAHGATSFGDFLYYLAGSDIATVGGTAVSGYATGLGGSVSGLSHDNQGYLWVNTGHGIGFQSALGGLFSAPSSSMADDNGGITPAVTDSGEFDLGGKQLSYYIGTGLTAGLKLNSDTTWSTMDDLLNFDQSLKDKLQGQIIRGVTATSTFAVLSTSIGAFRVSSAMLGQTANDLGKDLTKGTEDGTDNGTSIEIVPSDNTLLLGPVSAVSDGTLIYLFGGTTKGLFGSAASATGVPAGRSLALIAGSQGLNITKLATYYKGFASHAYTAAYSASTREVLILKDTAIVDHISAFEGLPSGDLQMTFYSPDSGATLKLVVTGADATVETVVAPSN